MAVKTGCVSAFVMCVALLAGSGSSAIAYSQAQPDAVAESVKVRVPGTTVPFEVVRCPSGEIRTDDEEDVFVGAMWVLTTEVTWDLYDIFAYQLDLEESERMKNADATTRPSRPYQSPDYGFGHQGYAAICVTYHAAEQFTVWLSEKTGKTYRLATDAEWQFAAQGGKQGGTELEEEALDALAWYRENASDKTQAVGEKSPNAIGVYDMLGNVREWVTGHDGKPVTRGGSFKDKAEDVQLDARAKQHWKWNETDPQIPKSKWWLSDGYHVGFRIVRVP